MMARIPASARRARIHGSAVALPTPFRGGQIDQDALATICERQITSGTTALVVCGSTGEAAALRPDEHRFAIRVVVEAAAGRVPVIAGCGALSTQSAAELAAFAAQDGATALLCAPPPYVKPTQDGMIGHLDALKNASNLPIIVYDVPGRTAVAIADATVARLYERGLIIGIKDATADLSRPPRLRALCGEDFVQMTGDDSTAAAYRAAGGHGCISVMANIAPALCRALHHAWDKADLRRFGMLRDQLAALSELLFLESNPIPLKAALASMGLLQPELRLPMTPASPATCAQLAAPLAALVSAEEAVASRGRYALAS